MRATIAAKLLQYHSVIGGLSPSASIIPTTTTTAEPTVATMPPVATIPPVATMPPVAESASTQHLEQKLLRKRLLGFARCRR